MNYPKILTVQPMDDYQLLVEFTTHEKRRYDVKPLLNKTMFAALKNAVFFKSVKVEQDGYTVSFDISEYELWRNGYADWATPALLIV